MTGAGPGSVTAAPFNAEDGTVVGEAPSLRVVADRVMVIGPADGGIAHVAASCARQMAAEGLSVTELVADTEGAPAWRALRMLLKHRAAVRAASTVHLEVGVTAIGVFWFGLWTGLIRRDLVAVIHDAPQIVRGPGAGLIRTAPGWRDGVAHKILSRLLDPLLLRLFRRSIRRYVVLSERAASAAGERGLGPVDVITHGADPATPGPAPRDGRYVLFAGFVGPGKGIEVLCRSWSSVATDLPLVIVGGHDRQHETWYQDRVGEVAASGVGSRVNWLGSVDDATFARYIAEAAVVVLPYTKANPASGILVRAMIQGRAIVATDIPTFAQHLVDGRNGILVPPGDPHRLACAIEKLLTAGDLADELGAAAGAHAAECFSWSTHVAGLRQSYRAANCQTWRPT